MRKLLLALPLILLIIGCREKPEPPTIAPAVTYEVIAPGDTLVFDWTALSDVDGYNVYVNGVKEWSGEETSVKITGPVKKVEICGYVDTEEGPKWSSGTDFVPVVTTLTVYGASDQSPDHPSGFGFDENGVAHAYPLSGPDTLTNWPKIDFYMEDRGNINMSLTSPSDAATESNFPSHHINEEDNTSADALTTDFDAAQSAPGPGTYLSRTEIAVNAVYYLWIDSSGNGWDNTEDHYGKVKIESVSGTEVQIKVAYQKTTGYRGTVTP